MSSTTAAMTWAAGFYTGAAVVLLTVLTIWALVKRW